MACNERRFWKDRGGAVAIYVAFISVALMGALVVALDFGRLTIVKTQMQNAADAAASAAAIQLDGQSGARNRATDIARNAARQESKILTTGGGTSIQVESVEFFSEFSPTQAATEVDANAKFVKVTIAPRNVTLLLEPALAALTGGDSQRITRIGASAVATSGPIICDPPPLLICNPEELSPPLPDITQPQVAGRQILIRKGGNSPAPGNFGLLCPPSNPNCSAGDIEASLAAVTINECTTGTVGTRPGVIEAKVNNGVNSRFDEGTLANPAKHIGVYPRDGSFAQDLLGDGVWDAEAYWSANHDHDADGVLEHPFPADLANATRYQVYLYERGKSFAYGATAATRAQTIVPVNCDSPPQGFTCPIAGPPPVFTCLNPSGFTCLLANPPSEDLPVGAVPPNNPGLEDPARRIMKAAVVDCIALGVSGRYDLAVSAADYVELFITEPVSGSGGDAPIVGEIVRTLTSRNSSDIRNNVRLVE